MEGIVLRYGFFYGPGTWFNPDGDVAQQVRQQQFPIVGNGEGVWSWLHIEDAAIATIATAERGNPGIYLIANDQPLSLREWLPAFARWLNAPPPPQVSVEDALKRDGVGCGLLRDSDARRVERQGKTRPEFSAATVGVDRWLKVSDCESHRSRLPMPQAGEEGNASERIKNGARGTRDIEGKAAREAASELGSKRVSIKKFTGSWTS